MHPYTSFWSREVPVMLMSKRWLVLMGTQGQLAPVELYMRTWIRARRSRDREFMACRTIAPRGSTESAESEAIRAAQASIR